MNKNIGIALLVVGILLLAAAILFAFWTGGKIVPVLTMLSIFLNAAGLTVLTQKKKQGDKDK